LAFRNLVVVTRVPLVLILVKVIILVVEVIKNALHPDRPADEYFRKDSFNCTMMDMISVS